MYAFLLILGAVIAAAGMLVAVPGLPFDGRDFDASIITPGAVAVVGGLILIGLGLAVRVLTRIERALAARPPLQPVASDVPIDAPAAAVPADIEPPKEAPPPRVAFPTKPEARPKPALVATAPTLPEDAALERLREQFPTLARIESAPVVDETDVSLLPNPPVRVEEDVAEAADTVVQVAGNVAANGMSNGAANGSAPAKVEPRIELPIRPASRPDRPRSFDAFWPKKPRPAARNGQAAALAPVPVPPPPAALQVVEPALPAEPTQFQFKEPASEPLLVAVPQPPVSVLKSGVVDGMAYTLYSDGSIEAQLAQGTLRFGSIAELRHHIEQSS